MGKKAATDAASSKFSFYFLMNIVKALNAKLTIEKSNSLLANKELMEVKRIGI